MKKPVVWLLRFLKKYAILMVPVVLFVVVGLYAAGFKPYHVEIIHTGSMEPTIPSRSAVLVRTGEYQVGQVITFVANGNVVTHRLVGFTAQGYTITKGDADRSVDQFHEPKSNILGGVVLAPRYLGFVLFSLGQPIGLLFMALLIAFLLQIPGYRRASASETTPATSVA